MKAKAVFFTGLFSLTLFFSFAFSQTDTIKVQDSSGDIGSFENPVPVLMTNSQIVRGLQLTLHFNTNLKFSSVTLTGRTSNFYVESEPDNQAGILRVIITSFQGAWIDSGSGEIMNLNFDVKPDAIPGNYLLNITEALGSDPFYGAISFYDVDGYFTVKGGVIPVELATFEAVYDAEKEIVRLNWTTLSEKNNYGFQVQRAAGDAPFANIGFIKGKGTSSEPQFYSFEDKSVDYGKFRYRLKQIDLSGSFHFSEIRTISIEPPKTFELQQNYPNPFSLTNPGTIIQFRVPTESWIEITIYDVLGREVRKLAAQSFPTGTHRISWDGADENGNLVPAGIYFYRLKSAKFRDMKKILILQ